LPSGLAKKLHWNPLNSMVANPNSSTTSPHFSSFDQQRADFHFLFPRFFPKFPSVQSSTLPHLIWCSFHLLFEHDW
jgi:hypothetical protein